MTFHDEVAAVRGPSSGEDPGPAAVEEQPLIRRIDHRCLLPSPALPGAGSTVGTSEVPSQPGPSELPCH